MSKSTDCRQHKYSPTNSEPVLLSEHQQRLALAVNRQPGFRQGAVEQSAFAAERLFLFVSCVLFHFWFDINLLKFLHFNHHFTLKHNLNSIFSFFFQLSKISRIDPKNYHPAKFWRWTLSSIVLPFLVIVIVNIIFIC